jgi:hypothetical protein
MTADPQPRCMPFGSGSNLVLHPGDSLARGRCIVLSLVATCCVRLLKVALRQQTTNQITAYKWADNPNESNRPVPLSWWRRH